MLYSPPEHRSYQILVSQHKNKKMKGSQHKLSLWYTKDWTKDISSAFVFWPGAAEFQWWDTLVPGLISWAAPIPRPAELRLLRGLNKKKGVKNKKKETGFG